MRRVIRRLVDLCAVLSLGLCAAVVVLWVESCMTDDDGLALTWRQGPGEPPTTMSGTSLVSSWGRVWFYRNRRHVPFLDGRDRATWAAELARKPVATGLAVRRMTNPAILLWDEPVIKRFGFVIARQGGYWERGPSGLLFADDQTFIGVPHGFLALVFAVLPTARGRAALKAMRRRRRDVAGRCRECGYDVRASIETLSGMRDGNRRDGKRVIRAEAGA